MTTLRVTHWTAAHPEACWALMADFGNIDFFNPHLQESYLLEGSPTCGLGTERQCNLKDGKNYIKEKVVAWTEGSSYTVDIYDGTMPVRDMLTTLGLQPKAGGTELYMQTQYQPKFGIAGKVMDRLILRRMMRGMMLNVIEGLGEKACAACPLVVTDTREI